LGKISKLNFETFNLENQINLFSIKNKDFIAPDLEMVKNSLFNKKIYFLNENIFTLKDNMSKLITFGNS